MEQRRVPRVRRHIRIVEVVGDDFDRLFGDTGTDSCVNGEVLNLCESDTEPGELAASNSRDLIMSLYEIRDHEGNLRFLE